MTLWNPQHTVDDLHELSEALFPYLEKLDQPAWSYRTGKRDKDWTVKETLAHINAISQVFQLSVESALTDMPLDIPTLAKRDDLRAFNDSEIARLSQHSSAELIDLLREGYADIEATIRQLTPEDYQKTIVLAVYNRSASVIDMIDFQLSHAGLIHGSQIKQTSDPATSIPLWWDYSDAMKDRMIDRFIRHLSYAYWKEIAGDLRGVIHFHFDTDSLGEWALFVSPERSWEQRGLSDETPLFDVYITDADTFFDIFTRRLTMMQAIQESHLRVEGNYPDPMSLLAYFSPAPPRHTLPDLE